MEHYEEDEHEPVSFRYRFHAFLSFRGEDTRHTFVKRLYNALDSKGVRTFRDDEGLDRGAEISSSLLEAIEDSSTSVVVLSRNYANSRWCLQELAKIVECRRLILPVFYQVDPSDVRRHKGVFDKDFRDHEERFGEDSDQVIGWKKAFEKVGGLSGWDSKNWEESELIQDVVERILVKMSNTPLGVEKHRVGINSRIEEVMRILDVKSGGVRVLGFHGMGGIGKTTLAKAVYNKIVIGYEHCSFISNIRTTSKQQRGLVSLQKKIIGDLRGDTSEVDEVSNGIATFKKIVNEKRVVLVLDDVGDIRELEALAGKRGWFGAGSRIIITTRDKQVLMEPLVNEIYEVKTLSQPESLQLFSYHAFGKGIPPDPFLHLSESIVSCTGLLPLALEVFGAFLFDKKRTNDWEDELKKLKKIRPGNLQDVLKISFDGLDEEEKGIFLDMACFFVDIGMQRESVVDILKGCGLNADIAITVLTTRSLIKIVNGDTVWMHDQLRDMGRQIVLEENLQDPGSRSRLWDRAEIMSVLEYNKGTRNVQGVILNFEKNGMQFLSSKSSSRNSDIVRSLCCGLMKNSKEKCMNPSGEVSEDEHKILYTKQFAPMISLRLLQINHVTLKGSFKLVPRELKWLQWKGCPLESLPSDFFPQELAVLDLTESKIKQVWERRRIGQKVAGKLMVLNLLGCFNLTSTPNFSGHPHLEKLILERCEKLIEIHKSVGDLKKLRVLNLNDCSDLVEFIDDISGLRCLESLTFSGCSKLRKIPEDLKSMKSLKELLLDSTAITKLPDSICFLTKLEKLSLNDCTLLQKLPESIVRLTTLKELSLNGSSLDEMPYSIGRLINLEKLSLMKCRLIIEIPDSIGKLKSLSELRLDSSAINELPGSIGSLYRLKHLSVTSCQLERLPSSIGGLSSLVELQLNGTLISELPFEIGKLQMLKRLEMRNCESLRCLPDSIGSVWSLTSLILVNTRITELPDSIGQLENLVVLNVNKCTQLCTLPTSIGNLKSLRQFLMEETSVEELPEEFGMLTSLQLLKMAKPKNRETPQNTAECRQPTVNEVKNPNRAFLPTSFSKLCSLETMDAKNCMIFGKIPDNFVKLSSLEALDLSHNIFCCLPTSMIGLSCLKELRLVHCVELKSLPPLPSSLTLVDATHCAALESVSDLSDMKNLEELRLTNCKQLKDIPGLECLKSLKRLYMSGCISCRSAINQRLSKVTLRCLRNLSVPGNEIPAGFDEEVHAFVTRRNHKIKCVLICVIISLDQQKQDNFRDKLPAVVDIQARIVRDKNEILTTTLYLMGVPHTNEDQLCLCRYLEFTPLVSMLKDGDKIQVIMRNPPTFNGLQLKKKGIHLVYEDDDDDNVDNEESLDETEGSVSHRLANFFNSLGEDTLTSDSGSP